MKKQNALRTLAALKALALLAMPTSALAGSASAVAPVSVTILAPFSVQTTQALAFGSVTKPSGVAGNTVSLDTNGNVTITGAGDATHPASPVTSAKFDLVGQAGVTYSTTQSLTFAQPGLTNVSVTSPVASTGTLGVIPPSGVQEIRFGGGFDLTSTTPTGAYTGALSVTVNYN